MKTRIGILASGAGSNARQIIQHFRDSPLAEIALVASNNATAGVLTIALASDVETALISRTSLYESGEFLELLRKKSIDFIVLAGFLWKIPEDLIKAFPGKIVNIHPALLPKYGGKGMYGHNVHEAVKNAGDNVSGITIHLVDGHYDSGDIIFQARVPLSPDDSAEEIESKVRKLELEFYAPIIEKMVGIIFQKDGSPSGG